MSSRNRTIGAGARIGLGSGVLIAALVLNLFVAPKWDPVFYLDAEFSPSDQLARERSHRIWSAFSGVLFVERLHANRFLCIPRQSSLYQHLDRYRDLTHITIEDDCEPLDFTDQPGDQLHPELVTSTVVKNFLFAFNPAHPPEGESAILVEAAGDTFVLVNTDTLAQLGLLPLEVSSR